MENESVNRNVFCSTSYQSLWLYIYIQGHCLTIQWRFLYHIKAFSFDIILKWQSVRLHKRAPLIDTLYYLKKGVIMILEILHFFFFNLLFVITTEREREKKRECMIIWEEIANKENEKSKKKKNKVKINNWIFSLIFFLVIVCSLNIEISRKKKESMLNIIWNRKNKHQKSKPTDNKFIDNDTLNWDEKERREKW